MIKCDISGSLNWVAKCLVKLTKQQRWSPLGRSWPRRHNLKSLSLKVKFSASKPASPRIEDSTIFWLVKNGPRSCALLFHLRAGASQRTCETKFWRPFLGRTLEFWENFENFWAKTFFLGGRWGRTLPRCVLGNWPQVFLFMALRGSVLERCFLGLGLFCVLGHEPCVLDSISAKQFDIYFDNLSESSWSIDKSLDVCDYLYMVREKLATSKLRNR